MPFQSTGLVTSKSIRGNQKRIEKSNKSVDAKVSFTSVKKASGGQWNLIKNGKVVGKYYSQLGGGSFAVTNGDSQSLINLTNQESRKVKKFLQTGEP